MDCILASRECVAGVSALNFSRRLWLLIVTSIVVAFLPHPTLAQQATLTDDAYTSTKKANRNFGDDQSLSVTATTERGFVKFKLTPSLPAGTVGGHVGKATLKIFVSDVASAGQLNIFRVTTACDGSNARRGGVHSCRHDCQRR
ncbi:MAG: hypothetical protein DMF74_26775 [Acidobacteria bacterium]|nr:MAG: hypothetical protein DMF74_26775 [Acidobacteriota bacterium]